MCKFPPPPPAESLSISRSYGDASASFAAAPAKGGLRIHTAGAKRRGFLILKPWLTPPEFCRANRTRAALGLAKKGEIKRCVRKGVQTAYANQPGRGKSGRGLKAWIKTRPAEVESAIMDAAQACPCYQAWQERTGLRIEFSISELWDGGRPPERGQAQGRAYRGRMTAGKAAAKFDALRRLHGDPATAPVADLAEQADADYDLADLALGPEGEQTTDKGHEKTTDRQAQ